jgi:hypothetical protein
LIDHTLDTEHAILFVRPKIALAQTVDSFIEEKGSLSGLIIEAPTFPGWQDLGAMVTHFRFVRDHHQKIKRVGLVTDSASGNIAEHLASHFVSAEIRYFAGKDREAAMQWVMNRP